MYNFLEKQNSIFLYILNFLVMRAEKKNVRKKKRENIFLKFNANILSIIYNLLILEFPFCLLKNLAFKN